jgi:serine/threonine-protein kinase
LAAPSQAAGVPTTDQPPAGRFVPPTPAELAPAFPHLEILELIGSGGMGAVYKARQVHLDRLVALKILPPQLAQDPAFEERFNREARVLARLNHPHIVTVHDFGHVLWPASVPATTESAEAAPAADGPRLYYLLMEYVDGTNLREVVRRGQLVPKEALAIVPQICEALQYAHDQGVVHRDIKPENILIDRQSRVKIADFGLAKIAGQPPAGEAAVVRQPFTLTATGQVMGTPHYMAPEQLRGSHEVDHRADIYSLGVVFYEMLTGELPIGKFAPPSRKVQVDVGLDEVVLRALENEPERRYQKASDVKTDVETISRTGSPQQHSTGHPEGTGGVPAPVPDAVVLRRATREV